MPSAEPEPLDPSLKRWLCLCIAKLCWRYRDAQDACVRQNVQGSLFACLRGEGETRGRGWEEGRKEEAGGWGGVGGGGVALPSPVLGRGR